jgi:CheY-like chemotaxis protein
MRKEVFIIQLETIAMNKRPILLVAEKDSNSFQLMKKQLRDSGCGISIVRFSSGWALLDFLAVAELAEYMSIKNFAVLIDTDLPEIDGMKVLKQIQKNRNLKKLPIVMVMENQDPIEISQGHNLGCGGFIRKPVDIEELFSAFEKLNVHLVSREIREIVI